MNNIIVSIHASTREATNLRGNIILFLYWFQSTPPRGRRLTTILIILTWQLFQSTPPRGRRPLPCHLQQIALIRFNPRLHAGGDAIRCPSLPANFCFNPRLHAGGDARHRHQFINRWRVSIHASTREATYPFYELQYKLTVSIHASTREATLVAQELF